MWGTGGVVGIDMGKEMYMNSQWWSNTQGNCGTWDFQFLARLA